MRLGKTLAVIRWILTHPYDNSESYPVLVVAPMSVLEAWEKELSLEGESYIVAHGRSFDQRVDLIVNTGFAHKGRMWVLINYDSLRVTPGISSLPWYAVILDESTIIKNPKAKITKLCTTGFREAKYRAILTGLPAPESDLDLFSQFLFLRGSFLGYSNYYEFRNECFRQLGYDWQPKPSVATKIKQTVHSMAYIRTRKNCGLPNMKVREIRKVRMTPEQHRLYDRVEDEFVAELQGVERETDQVITQRMWLARLAGGCNADGTLVSDAKARELLYLLKSDLANQPVVVYFRFTSEIFAVKDVLKKAGVLCETLTGSDTREERKRKQEWFRNSRIDSRVMLVQIKKVAEYGVDMSVSSTIVYYSVSYSVMEMAQTEERIYHPKKCEPLLYLYLVTENSIDEDAVGAIRSKVSSSKMFMVRLNKNFLSRFESKRKK